MPIACNFNLDNRCLWVHDHANNSLKIVWIDQRITEHLSGGTAPRISHVEEKVINIPKETQIKVDPSCTETNKMQMYENVLQKYKQVTSSQPSRNAANSLKKRVLGMQACNNQVLVTDRSIFVNTEEQGLLKIKDYEY